MEFIDHAGKSSVFELIVLRDSTLKQLMDGVFYGLQKRKSDEFYGHCFEVFTECILDDNHRGVLPKITITSYNEYAEGALPIVNGRAVISLKDFDKKLFEIGVLSSTRFLFDCSAAVRSIQANPLNIIPAFSGKDDDEPEVVFPEYNISTRQLYRFNDEPIEIISPQDPPAESEQNLLMMLLPTMLMMIAMVFIRGVLMSSTTGMGKTMIIMSVSMSAITIFSSVLNWRQQKKKYRQSVQDWKDHYQEYIKRLIASIKKRQDDDVKKMEELYPNLNKLLEYGATYEKSVFSVSGDIFSRTAVNDDFLAVRLGISSKVKSKFEIKSSKKDVVFSPAYFRYKDSSVELYLPNDEIYKQLHSREGIDVKADEQSYLSNLPDHIANRFKYYMEAPYLFSLKNCGALGLLTDVNENAEKFLKKVIFELCFYHSPEELQLIVLFEPTSDRSIIERKVKMFKFMPHFRELFSDRAQFVFDNESANAVFGSLLNIASERADEQNGITSPHIIMIVYHEYGMKEHAFAGFLPREPKSSEPYENNLHFTFVFIKKYAEHLPKYCNYLIKLNNDCSGVVIPHEDEKQKVDFSEYSIIDNSSEQGVRDPLYLAYKVLSTLSYSKISQNGKVPSNVGLFELYDITNDNLKIAESWGNVNGKRRYDVTQSLGVPIGKTDSGITCLDLHERADGPHMLVAGTTGSGKSETIISFLLGLVLRFRPDEVNFLLVDMKGGGFINRLGELPHVVGKVTDVDGDENGTGAVYTLKRFLDALTSEIKRRKILFNSMRVDSIDGYISACRNIEEHIKNKASDKGLTDEEADQIRRQAKRDVLSHLILIVDEFTELKRFSSDKNDLDFIGEITTIARVGRSLGIHIILVSQNIEGAITDDIRVNSKSRLCLKVATRQASKEMIGNDLAASPNMPGNGRAYLLVGTGSKFEYFQSAYTGANILDNIEIPTTIIEASKSGRYTQFYDSEKDNTDMHKRKAMLKERGELKTQLSAVVNGICEYHKQHGSDYATPHIVFQNPLPNKIILKEGKVWSFVKGKYEPMSEVMFDESAANGDI